MRLRVHQLAAEEVYRDMARVPEEYRLDREGKRIPEAKICEVLVEAKSKLLILRGRQGCYEPIICVDEKTRDSLGIKEKSDYEFQLLPVGFLREFAWAWNATDPTYWIPARLAIISFSLSVLSLVLGIVGLVVAFAN